MLKRKGYDFLLNWKNSKDKECLLIKGARQVGKTFLVEEFGKNEYDSFIEINFYKEPELKDIFKGSLKAEEILKQISIYKPESKLIPKKTLIFLDEIQKCSNARTSLKFLAQDNRYDIIASGSLLGLSYGTDADKDVQEVESIPVGYETQYTMYSLDFEEFLWANGQSEENIEYLRKHFESKEKVPENINDLYEKLFREFIIVGGMPEVVASYVKTHDFSVVKHKQEKIISNYNDDISKHAKTIEKTKVRNIYESLPIILAKENKRFSYAQVEKKAGSKKYGSSITWLKDANLVNTCFNVSEPNIPLISNSKEKEFKLYINDTGLLMTMYGDESKKLIINNKIKGNAKGGIYENVIAECLIKKGYILYCYKTTNSSEEIEFLIEKNEEVIPIEVKAGNSASISLNNFIKKNKPSIAYKFINGNVGVDKTKYSLPHYMIMFI